MADDCGHRTWSCCSSEIAADRSHSPLLEADSHSRRCAGGHRSRTPVFTVSSSRTYSGRLAWYVCAEFPLQWSGVRGTQSGGACAVVSWAGGTRRISDCNLAEKRIVKVVLGCLCLANGRISVVRPGCLPVVSALAAAVSDFDFDAAARRLDREHYPHLRQLALAHAWTSVGGASWLDNAA